MRGDQAASADTFNGHACKVHEEWVTYLLEQLIYVEPTAKAREWYSANKAKLDDKRRTTLPRWEDAASKGSKDSQTLHPEDGI